MNTGQQTVHSLSQRVSKERVRRFDRHRNVVLLLIYFVAGSILYANSLDNSFHFDDIHATFQNQDIYGSPDFLTLWTTVLKTGGNSVGEGHYRPLVLSTYLLNYLVGGLDPRGYHAVNLLIHILAAFLAALVMDQLTGRWVVGALSGLLFLVHPFNAEAVNYVTARSSQLYALFYLLSFYAYLRYRSLLPKIPLNPPLLKGEKGGFLQVGKKGHPYFWLGLSLLSFVLSLLSKEMAVALPMTLFLYEWFLGYPMRWADRLRRLWIPAGFGIVVIASYLLVRRILSGAALPSEMGRNLMSQLYTEGVVLVKTLGLVLWPANLTIDHRVESYDGFAAWPVAGSFLVLVGLMVFVLWWGRSTILNRRLCAFLLAWFFVALSPLMALRLTAMLQENRACLAMAGVVGLMGVGVVWILDRARSRGPFLLKGVWAGVMVLVLIYAALTQQRNIVWQDDLSLWTDAVNKNPYSAIALDNLGATYRGMGRFKEAIEQFQAAHRLDPSRFIAVYNLGLIAEDQGKFSEAEQWYRLTLQMEPGFYKAYVVLGLLHERAGRPDDAIREYSQVLNLYPDFDWARFFLGNALFKTGRYQEADREYTTLLQKGTDDPELKAALRNAMRKFGEKIPMANK